MAEQNLTSIVGVVESVEGNVVIQQSDGGQNTPVSEGMQLAANQIIQTGPQGAVLINLANGQTLSLGRNTTLKLDEDVTGIAAIEDAQATDEDVQQVIEKYWPATLMTLKRRRPVRKPASVHPARKPTLFSMTGDWGRHIRI